MKKKILIGSMLVISILVMIPFSSAVTVNTNVDNESRENSEIEPLGSSRVVYAIISGACTGFDVERGFLIRRGQAEFWAGPHATVITINGYTWPLWDSHSHFCAYATYVKASHFIGFIMDDPIAPIWGIAFGDIEWS